MDSGATTDPEKQMLSTKTLVSARIGTNVIETVREKKKKTQKKKKQNKTTSTN